MGIRGARRHHDDLSLGHRCERGLWLSNVADDTMRRAPGWLPSYTAVGCDDQGLFTVPVGRYRPNAFGLYDVIGNANEWVADCYRTGYVGAPADGSAIEMQGCPQRVVRGAGWSSNPFLSRSAARTLAVGGTAQCRRLPDRPRSLTGYPAASARTAMRTLRHSPTMMSAPLIRISPAPAKT
jgi:hypothetical protein